MKCIPFSENVLFREIKIKYKSLMFTLLRSTAYTDMTGRNTTLMSGNCQLYENYIEVLVCLMSLIVDIPSVLSLPYH